MISESGVLSKKSVYLRGLRLITQNSSFWVDPLDLNSVFHKINKRTRLKERMQILGGP